MNLCLYFPIQHIFKCQKNETKEFDGKSFFCETSTFISHPLKEIFMHIESVFTYPHAYVITFIISIKRFVREKPE